MPPKVAPCRAGRGGRRRRLFGLILLLLLVLPMQPASAQDDARSRQALAQIVEFLSPAERVGQLLLLPLPPDREAEADRWIDAYGIGGLVLEPLADGGPDSARRMAERSSARQARAGARQGARLPLLLAIAYPNAGQPGSAEGGLASPWPSLLSVGATWQDEHALSLGETVGAEMAAMGLNLLLGPALDVHDAARPATTGDLGLGSFGGSPAWVGRMGREFATGLHQGADGRVALASGSFPGIGAADRSQSQEVAVVERSLEQLLSIDLLPYASAFAAPEGEDDRPVEALVSALVRYPAIQQQPDRPFSLDSGGLSQLSDEFEPYADWLAAGGLRISPGLGQPSVRRYVDAEQAGFNPRRVIREALMAGNDLLDLSGFDAAAGEIDEGLRWLVEAYDTDEALRLRVDESLLKVLALKQRLYGDLALTPSSDPDRAAEEVGQGGELVGQIARDALTLLSPRDGSAPPAPEPGQRVLLVVDSAQASRCPSCPAQPDLEPAALVEEIRQAYGPGGVGTARLADDDDVSSISFRELRLWLQDAELIAQEEGFTALERQPEDQRAAVVETRIEEADWLVFALSQPRPAEAQASDALRLLLTANPFEREDKRLVVLAFAAPYYLETSEIASLSAYYGVYGRSQAFRETAIRALFGDLEPRGASPVSVPGVGYALEDQLEPAKGQSIALEPVGLAVDQSLATGDSYRVRTTPILDLNGKPVPDGTPITFRRYLRSSGVFLEDLVAETQRGRAIALLRAEREGEVEISALHAGELLSELPLVIAIEPQQGAVEPGIRGVVPWRRDLVPADWGIFLLSLSLVLLAGVLVYGANPATLKAPTLLVRMFMISLAWGLAGYLLVVAGGLRLEALPILGGWLWRESWNPAYQAPLVSFGFAFLPLLPTVLRALGGRN